MDIKMFGSYEMIRFLVFSICLLIPLSYSEAANSTACLEKEKAFALLDIAEDSLSKAKQLFPTCKNSSTASVSDCGVREKSLAYLKIAQNLIGEAKEHFPSCNYSKSNERPLDCFEILVRGNKRSGVYTIWPISRSTKGKSVNVYCDMDTDGGGWTVIQRRGNFSPLQDFYQDWKTYKIGFGNITRDFWLGNDNIHALSNQFESEIRFDLQKKSERRFALYKTFWIDDETSNYTLHLKSYKDHSRTPGNCMDWNDGVNFSTKDKGTIEEIRCANERKGGWWYDSCTPCNLNGIYKKVPSGTFDSIYWNTWSNFEELESVEIKVRRIKS